MNNVREVKLRDVCEIEYGKDHRGLSDGAIPVYGSGGITRYVDRALYEGPSVLIPRKGTLENLFYLEQPFWTIDTLFWTRISTGIIYPKYLFYVLKTKDLASLNVGTAVPSLTSEILYDVVIPLPDMHIQKAIVACLDIFDKRIVLNQKINDYLEELIIAIFKRTSGKTSQRQSRAASNFFEIGIGKTPPRKESKWFSNSPEGNVKWLSIKDMGEPGIYALDSSEYLTPEAITQKNVRKARKGSVLLSFKLTIGRVKIASDDMATNEAIACFASDDQRMLWFLYPYLKTFDYGELGNTSSIATAINSKTVKNIPIAMPSLNELNRFCAQVNPLYQLEFSIQRENALLAKYRDLLLPKLMSGEIDVSKVDITQLNNHLSES